MDQGFEELPAIVPQLQQQPAAAAAQGTGRPTANHRVRRGSDPAPRGVSGVFDSIAEIARELAIAPGQARSAAELLQEGATVPFIARYRKERTGSLDETQIRQVEERWRYYGELAERREAVLASIEEQGKLTDELRAKVEACRQKQEL